MEKQEQAKPVRGQNLLEWYEALISAALVLVLIFSFFFRIIQVDGSSMVPTLVNGDKLIVWGAGYTPQRGDVVIVDSYTSYGKPLVKRVIAKGGDTVSIDYATGTVAVNGEVLQEDYIAEPMSCPSHRKKSPWQLQKSRNDRRKNFSVSCGEGTCYFSGGRRRKDHTDVQSGCALRPQGLAGIGRYHHPYYAAARRGLGTDGCRAFPPVEVRQLCRGRNRCTRRQIDGPAAGTAGALDDPCRYRAH